MILNNHQNLFRTSYLWFAEMLHNQLYLSWRECSGGRGHSAVNQCFVEWFAADYPVVHDSPYMLFSSVWRIEKCQLGLAVAPDSKRFHWFILCHVCLVFIGIKILIISEMSKIMKNFLFLSDDPLKLFDFKNLLYISECLKH